MALFGGKKKDEAKAAPEKEVKASKKADKAEKKASSKEKKADKKAASSEVSEVMMTRDLSRVLRKPRITEKAAYLAEKNVYVFNIDPRATKTDVIAALKELYKVTPKKVRIVTLKKKPTFTRRIRGKKGGGKKAYIYLKKGDNIKFA